MIGVQSLLSYRVANTDSSQTGDKSRHSLVNAAHLGLFKPSRIWICIDLIVRLVGWISVSINDDSYGGVISRAFILGGVNTDPACTKPST